ncbi:MAG: hypothetical protein NC824_04995 [Candidatus Omnitrophica bacterium]|nr:hypothetical protein [Candidatus Omnitrophota bacterium]
MKLIDAYIKIIQLNQPVLKTDDVAQCLDVTKVNASKIMERLRNSEYVLKITRGLWAIKDKVTLWDLAGYITNPMPYYISLQSALYYYGIISQIPEILYVISPARTRLVNTPLGSISIHHIQTSFFCGYKKSKEGFYIATQEKALIDFLYFSPARSYLFHNLPEVEIPENFSICRAEKFIKRIRSKRRQSAVHRLFQNILLRKNK